MKTIETRDATVKTLSIEAKVIKMGPKQVTLSVFRQLLTEPLIDAETLQLRGVPWGRVNYRWGDCANKPQSHLHIVWQLGGELRRACVDQSIRDQDEVCDIFDDLDGLLGDLRDLHVLARGLVEKPLMNKHMIWFPNKCAAVFGQWDYPANRIREYWREADRLREYDAGVAAGTEEPAADWRKHLERERDSLHRELTTRIKTLCDQTLSPECRKRLATDPGALVSVAAEQQTEQNRRVEDYRVGWADRYAELRSLDQLFIAV